MASALRGCRGGGSPPAPRERARPRCKRRRGPRAPRCFASGRADRHAGRSRAAPSSRGSGRRCRSPPASRSSVSGIEVLLSRNRSESKRASENSTRSRGPSWPAGFGLASERLRGPNRWASTGSASNSPRSDPGVSPSLRPSSASVGLAGRVVARRRQRRPLRRRRREARHQRVVRLVLPVGRRVAAEVEEPFEGIEDGVAATATHPAFGHLELVLDDSKRRPARGAARRQTHRQIMPCGERRIACRRGGSSRRLRRRRRARATARRRGAARRPGARARRTGPARPPARPVPTAPARAA